MKAGYDTCSNQEPLIAREELRELPPECVGAVLDPLALLMVDMHRETYQEALVQTVPDQGVYISSVL